MGEMKLNEVADLLRSGEIVAHPTETVYGLGVLASNQDALRRLKALKGSAEEKSFLVLIPDRSSLSDVVESQHEMVSAIMDAFWPGPLTLVLKVLPNVSLPTSQGFAGFRVSSHPIASQLVKEIGVAMVSTSANKTGSAPTSIREEVMNTFRDGVFFPFLDDADGKKPSTVLKIDGLRAKVLREGPISKEEIDEVISVYGAEVG